MKRPAVNITPGEGLGLVVIGVMAMFGGGPLLPSAGRGRLRIGDLARPGGSESTNHRPVSHFPLFKKLRDVLHCKPKEHAGRGGRTGGGHGLADDRVLQPMLAISFALVLIGVVPATLLALGIIWTLMTAFMMTGLGQNATFCGERP